MFEKLKQNALVTGFILIIISSLTYPVSWILTYNPSGLKAGIVSNILIILSFILGMAGALTVGAGISASANAGGKKFKITHLLIIITAFFFTVYFITLYWFKREFTSEIFLMFIWLGLISCSIYILFYKKSLSKLQMIIASILVFLSISLCIVSYTIHYNLTDYGRFINGTIPYFVASASMAVILIFVLFRRIKKS